LEQPDGSEVVGTIVLDPNDDRFVLYDVDIDTAPQNTLDAIDAVINPTAWPQVGRIRQCAGRAKIFVTEAQALKAIQDLLRPG
jgi:hypothetical protein